MKKARGSKRVTENTYYKGRPRETKQTPKTKERALLQSSVLYYNEQRPMPGFQSPGRVESLVSTMAGKSSTFEAREPLYSWHQSKENR